MFKNLLAVAVLTACPAWAQALHPEPDPDLATLVEPSLTWNATEQFIAQTYVCMRSEFYTVGVRKIQCPASRTRRAGYTFYLCDDRLCGLKVTGNRDRPFMFGLGRSLVRFLGPPECDQYTCTWPTSDVLGGASLVTEHKLSAKMGWQVSSIILFPSGKVGLRAKKIMLKD